MRNTEVRVPGWDPFDFWLQRRSFSMVGKENAMLKPSCAVPGVRTLQQCYRTIASLDRMDVMRMVEDKH